MIVRIKVGKITFYAEMSEASFGDKNFEGVSILQNLVSLIGISAESNGKYKGELDII